MKFVGELVGHAETPCDFIFNNASTLLYSIEKRGNILIFDLNNYKLVKKINTHYRRKVALTFLGQKEKYMYLLRMQGNLQKVNLKTGNIEQDQIISDEDVTACDYNQKTNKIYTGDSSGIMIQTVLQNQKLKGNELVDKSKKIQSIMTNKEGDLIAFATD